MQNLNVQGSINSARIGDDAYSTAQKAIGAPAYEVMPIAQWVDNIREALEIHRETLDALARRLHPVTNLSYASDDPLSGSQASSQTPKPAQSDVADTLEVFYCEIKKLTSNTTWLIKALEI